MKRDFLQRLNADTEQLRAQGLFKPERVLSSPQSSSVRVAGGSEVSICAPTIISGWRITRRCAKQRGWRWTAMVTAWRRCASSAARTRSTRISKQRLSRFLGTEDTILYSSCFDANGGLFETLLDEQDAVISDALNHASIIDGIRLCKAQRFRYANNDLDELETRLKEAANCRVRLIATDGVFSMDGVIARLQDICDLADRYDALVMVDDSHAVGFVGERAVARTNCVA